ncbi:MAG: SUF system Fe-S cluster assembly regulator [Coxiellaceae bacterium]|nr:MAG: SUF system Fe-S cluster assembly regulator [Coxiellaceae bacterium]
MLRISKLADYAMVIMNYMARQPTQLLSAAGIARQVPVAAPTVSKILKLLSEAGLVASARGAGGGYRLAKSPEEITLADMVTAIDGLPAITECSQSANLCAHDSICSIRGNWLLINQVISEVLESLTLADMAKPLHKPMLTQRVKAKYPVFAVQLEDQSA